MKSALSRSGIAVAGLSLALMIDHAAMQAAETESAQEWDAFRGGEVLENDTALRRTQDELAYISVRRPIENSSTTYDLHFFQSADHVAIPVGIRKPEGEGPFPAIIVGSGNGNDSFMKIQSAMYRYEPMIDMMVDRGYVVAFSNYRNEIPGAYNEYERCDYLRDDASGGARALLNAPCLDHNDYIELIEHVKSLPYVESDAVGTVGSSHNGELQLKAASEISWGAAVVIEGASHEFLAVDVPSAPRREIAGEGRLLWLPDVESTLKYTDLERAKSRVADLNDNMPFFHIGREADHLQGIFRLAYELSADSGKNVEWKSYGHDLHGFGLLSREQDGAFEPGEVRMAAFNDWMAFFDRHLRGEASQ